MNTTSSSLPLGKRLRRFVLAVACVLFCVFVLGPFVIRHFPPMHDFAQSVREQEQNPGALYYTDVPDSSLAELHNRSTIRFFANRNASR